MILGVIPARGKSKGIPRKNIRPLFKKPLLLWSIEAAQQSQFLNEFVVSTDDIEIANLAIWAGANVMIRPDELATDTATTLAVLMHILEHYPRKIDTMVLLQPTSPFRFGNIIDNAIKTFREKEGHCDCLATGYWTTHRAWTNEHGPRQNMEEYFHDDGCVYIWNAAVIREGLWQGESPCYMAVDSIYNTEIDEEADFWRIEGIMRHYEEQ